MLASTFTTLLKQDSLPSFKLPLQLSKSFEQLELTSYFSYNYLLLSLTSLRRLSLDLNILYLPDVRSGFLQNLSRSYEIGKERKG